MMLKMNFYKLLFHFFLAKISSIIRWVRNFMVKSASLDSHYETSKGNFLHLSNWLFLELLGKFGNSAVFIRLKYSVGVFFNWSKLKVNLSLITSIFCVETEIYLVQILLRIIYKGWFNSVFASKYFPVWIVIC